MGTQNVIELVNDEASLDKYIGSLKLTAEQTANLKTQIVKAKPLLAKLSVEQLNEWVKTGDRPLVQLSPHEMEAVSGGGALTPAHPSLYGFFCYLVIGDAAFSHYADY